MNLDEENNRNDFDIYCTVTKEAAKFMGATAVERILHEKLPEKETIRKISLKIKEVTGQIITLNRPDYLENSGKSAQLYEMFKRTNNLSNTDELNKLQLAMNLGEEFMQLQLVLFNICMGRKASNSHQNGYWLPGTPDTEAEEQSLIPVVKKLQEATNLVLLPSTLDDFIRLATCHDWSLVNVKLYVGCKTNELKCIVDCIKTFNPDFNYANIGRSGLFISKTGRPITAHDLTASSYKKLNTRAIIENIFAQYKRKL